MYQLAYSLNDVRYNGAAGAAGLLFTRCIDHSRVFARYSCLAKNQGGFAHCYRVTCVDTARVYAMKIVPKSTLVKSRARQKVRGRKEIEGGQGEYAINHAST